VTINPRTGNVGTNKYSRVNCEILYRGLSKTRNKNGEKGYGRRTKRERTKYKFVLHKKDSNPSNACRGTPNDDVGVGGGRQRK
jgi:hypothetical protein